MAERIPKLITSKNLHPSVEEDLSASASPARGVAMLSSIFKQVRVPEFRFKWMYWFEKGRAKPAGETASQDHPIPRELSKQIVSIKDFYEHFNNFPHKDLVLRDTLYFFHAGVQPVWEDPRNVKGGAFYFKVPKENAIQFWHELCLMAVGDVLQGAVETKRKSFNDDICGLSYSVRWAAVQISVWNRDAENEEGKAKLLAVILDKLTETLQPKPEAYWYKAHKEHSGFVAAS